MTTHHSGPLLESGSFPREALRNLPAHFAPDHQGIFDDFNRVTLDATNDWTVVKDSSAAVAIAADVANGRATLTSQATTDDDGSSIQGNEIFLPASGREIFVEALVQVSDADDMDFYFGLTENFATNPEAVLAASNMIGFLLVDGDATLQAKTEKADSETLTSTQIDLADATDVRLGLKVTGVDVVHFYVNRILRATITTNVPVVELAVAAFELSGSATGTKSASIDYILAVQSR